VCVCVEPPSRAAAQVLIEMVTSADEWAPDIRCAIHTSPIHRRCIYKGDTSTHAEGTDPGGGLERASESWEAL